ncbi:MAG: hypothetical protein ACR2NN_16290, partial [Bryobacteraceae bacterium]
KRRARMQKRSSFYPLTPNQKGVPAPDRSASYPGSFFDEKMLARQPVNEPEAKLKAVRRGAKYSFQTADAGQMLREIERDYQA